MKKAACYLLICVLLVSVDLAFAQLVGASIVVTEQLMTIGAADQYDAVVSGGNVAYTDMALGTEDIHRVDTALNVFAVAVYPANQCDADIDRSRIVYVDDQAGNYNIFLHDFDAGTTDYIITWLSDDYDPAISGDNVVYVSNRMGNDDIIWYDVATGEEETVTMGDGYEGSPAIDGNLVAWHVYENGSYNVYASELGGVPFIVADSSAHELSPSVSGNLIAYVIDGDIAVFDYASGVTAQITNDEYLQLNVRVDEHYVLWNDDRNGNSDVFLYNLIDGQTYQLTDDPSDQILTDVSGNRAVCHDDRAGNLNIWSLEWFFLGDANGDGLVNVGDLVYMVNYLYRGGSAPDPSQIGDVNCDEVVDIGDVVYLVNYLYRGGDPPDC